MFSQEKYKNIFNKKVYVLELKNVNERMLIEMLVKMTKIKNLNIHQKDNRKIKYGIYSHWILFSYQKDKIQSWLHGCISRFCCVKKHILKSTYYMFYFYEQSITG